jgi:3',5'-cyclic AMP phosphodiesterase CpdA
MKRVLASVAVAVWILTLVWAVGAQAPPQTSPQFFIQLSDTQFGMFTDNAGFDQETANLEFAVTAINRLRPVFVVVTGDLVNRAGDQAQIAEYLRIMSKIDPAIRVYNVAGNHDVENAPTPASLAAWAKRFGPDYYSFRHGDLAGIVLNSCLIAAPQGVPTEAAAQDKWLEAELASARKGAARHIVVFLHHPLFANSPDEPDKYENLPLERRTRLLDLFRKAGVRQVFAGHYHKNALARAGDIEMVTSGPVGMPLGDGRSGLRVGIVTEGGIEHRYYDFGVLPNRIGPAASR